MALWGAVTGGGNLIYHAAGWLEGGLVSSFEKVIIDAEMLQMMIKLYDEPSFVDDEFAIDAMAEVGPGGHFFGCAHTLERYKDAFTNRLSVTGRTMKTAGSRQLTATERNGDLAANS